MPIVVCSWCQARITVKPEFLGRKAKCPKCTTMILLQEAPAGTPDAKPAAAPKPAPTARPAPKPAEKDLSEATTITPQPPKPKPAAPRAVVPPPLPPPDDDDVDQLEVVSEKPMRASSRQAAFDAVDDDPPEEVWDEDEEQDHDDSRPSRRGKNRSSKFQISGSWDGPQLGLKIVFIAVCVIGGGFFLNQFLGLITALVGISSVIGILQIGVLVLVFIAFVLRIVGQFYCISTPVKEARTQAKVGTYLILSAVCLVMLGFLLIMVTAGSIAAFGINQGGGGRQFNPDNARAVASAGLGMMCVVGIFFVSAGICALVGYIFWILYHATVADSLRDQDLKFQFIILLFVGIAVPIVWSLLAFLSGAMFGPRVGNIIANLFGMIGFTGVYGWYLLLNRKLAGLIETRGD